MQYLSKKARSPFGERAKIVFLLILYLDLSTFSGDVKCYLIIGYANGRHMWNIIRMNGKSYQVDVTWRDGDYEGNNVDLLLGGTSTDGGKSYAITFVGDYVQKRTNTYEYDEDMFSIYDEEILTLSSTNYHPKHSYSDTYISDETQHWRACCCGLKIDISNHDDLGRTATCSYIAICGTCKAYHGTVAPHSYTREFPSSQYLKTDATCTSYAVYYHSCSWCGLKGTTTFTSGFFKAHTYNQTKASDKYLVEEATCTSRATYYYSCTCGETGTQTFTYGEFSDNHHYTNKIVKDVYLASEATCTSKATYYYSCECGAHGEETFENGVYKNHVYDQRNTSEEYLLKEATCIVQGMYFISCECGKKGGELFYTDRLSHEYDENGNCIFCNVNVNGDLDDDFNDDFSEDNNVEITPDENPNENTENNKNNNPVVNYESYPWIIRIIFMILALILGL